MRYIKHCCILAGTALLAACASAGSEPPSISTGTATAQVQKPSGAMPDTNGYQKVMMNGEERYCRSDVDTGSHVARSRVCYTPAQLKAIQDEDQANLSNLTQKGNGAGANTGMQSGLGR